MTATTVGAPTAAPASASALTSAIGARVRAARQGRRWTLDDLAAAADLSRRTLVSIEQGTTNPSIRTLLRLADALGTGLPALVEPPQAQTSGHVTRAGAGSVLWTGDAGGRGVLVAGTRAPDVLELWDWAVAPGERHTSEAHSSGTHELLQVLEGELVLILGEERLELGTGDAVSFRGDVPHAYANEGAGPVRFSLAVHEPVGGRRA